jgi:hypothetical protein
MGWPKIIKPDDSSLVIVLKMSLTMLLASLFGIGSVLFIRSVFKEVTEVTEIKESHRSSPIFAIISQSTPEGWNNASLIVVRHRSGSCFVVAFTYGSIAVTQAEQRVCDTAVEEPK